MADPRSAGAPTVLRVVLGKRLQDLREKAGLSFEQAAAALDVTHATIRRMEKAEVGLKLPYVEKLLATYGVTDEKEIEGFVSSPARPTSPAGGTGSAMSCPSGSVPSSAWRAKPTSSGPTNRTTSPGCCRPRTTPPPS